MRRLTGRIRGYAWGSRTALAALQGRAPTGQPEAELWYGAHPDDPSTLSDGVEQSLLAAIEADPAALLGASVAGRYGGRLPYLLKVLAADAPLSLQAHPSADQARAGFDAEAAAGTPREQRNYTDPYHKPELLVAVTEFEALCGFRPAAEAAAVLRPLQLSELDPVVTHLTRGDLRRAVTGLYALPDERRVDLVKRVQAACASGPEREHTLAAELAERYPGDIGVVISLLLNRVLLRPGEAIYMPAGNLHAYLSGLGVEIMASSDNVLRGGLTPKRVDVPELLRVLRFEELADPRLGPMPAGPGVVRWPTPLPDFQLARATVTKGEPARLPGDGPRIVLCLSGRVRAADDQDEVMLGPGEAGFAAATAGPVTLSGAGEAYQASVGQASVGPPVP